MVTPIKLEARIRDLYNADVAIRDIAVQLGLSSARLQWHIANMHKRGILPYRSPKGRKGRRMATTPDIEEDAETIDELLARELKIPTILSYKTKEELKEHIAELKQEYEDIYELKDEIGRRAALAREQGDTEVNYQTNEERLSLLKRKCEICWLLETESDCQIVLDAEQYYLVYLSHEEDLTHSFLLTIKEHKHRVKNDVQNDWVIEVGRFFLDHNLTPEDFSISKHKAWGKDHWHLLFIGNKRGNKR